jgi:SsrA-binding protein
MAVRKPLDYKKNIAQNRRARYDYFIDEVLEVGIVLTGTEVKSLRKNEVSISESHAMVDNGEIFLVNANIPEYDKANQFNHYPRRPRKLLLRKKDIKKLIGLVQRKGCTLVPVSMYFNYKNLAKVELGVARGKKEHDKRETIKQADWQRQKARVLKGSTD